MGTYEVELLEILGNEEEQSSLLCLLPPSISLLCIEKNFYDE